MLPMSAGIPQLAPTWFTSQMRSPLTTSPSLTQLLASPHFQTLLQTQVAALQQQQLAQHQSDAPAKSPRTPAYCLPRKRVGGSTMKTAKVWRFFDELPSPEQAAECRICHKKIKATNSSTTGMIRHLRSCHVIEYQQVQEARQSSLLMKMEEKTKVQLLRDLSNEVRPTTTKPDEAQKSPSALSSASDTASTASNPFAPVTIPMGLPAPKPMKPLLKTEPTEIEDIPEQPEVCKMSAFASVKKEPYGELDDDTKKLNAQIALMLLMDQHAAQIVDRPGFQQLIRFLRPNHQLPCSRIFERELMPEIMAQIRQFGAMMMLNNPVSNPLESLAPTPDVSTPQFSYATESSKADSAKGDEDSDSTSTSSSADSESPSQIAELVQYFGGRVSHDDLVPLVSVCRSASTYFEDKPADLPKLTVPPTPAEPSEPSLLRELRFAAQNADAINQHIRTTPGMELLPISDAQRRILSELVP